MIYIKSIILSTPSSLQSVLHTPIPSYNEINLQTMIVTFASYTLCARFYYKVAILVYFCHLHMKFRVYLCTGNNVGKPIPTIADDGGDVVT